MGREIRMVPPNWEHPKALSRNGRLRYVPMRDMTYEEAAEEWKAGYAAWEAGDRPAYCGEYVNYWEWCNPPQSEDMYRTWKEEDATWYQVWETVSEGTPVSPPFATKEELVEYLVANGDFWDQQRREEQLAGHPMVMNCAPWSRADAERFVYETQWSMSLIADNKGIRSGHREE